MVLSDLNTAGSNHVSTLCKAAGNQILVGFINGKQLSLDAQTLKSTDLPQQDPAGSMVNANAWSAETGELWSGKRALAYFSSGNWTNVLLPAPGRYDTQTVQSRQQYSNQSDSRRLWACSRQMFVCGNKTHRFIDISTKHGLKKVLKTSWKTARGRFG